MNGVIYTRVSSDEQIDGTSLASQEELCRKYCEQKQIAVVALFREEGESAKDLSLNNRSQFLSALEFCRRQKNVAAFVVYRVDRFARNTEDHFSVRRILSTYGTALHSVTEPIGNKPAEKFIETVLAGAAEYDNAVRKQRCTEGMVARINQGIWPFRPPVGYLCAHHRRKGEKKTVPDEPDDKLFPIIQRGLRKYASGELSSQAALARQLNIWGYERICGKAATPQLVDRLLGSNLTYYTGRLVNPWTGEDRPGQHRPMLSIGEAAHVRLRRAGVIPTAPARRLLLNPAFPLRRLLRCTACGHPLTGAQAKGNGGRFFYYYCVQKGCENRYRSIRDQEVHRLFAVFLRGLRPSVEQLGAFRVRLERCLTNHKHGTGEEAERHRQLLAQLQERRQRIFEMREDGSYTVAAFRERLVAVDIEISRLTVASQDLPDLATIDFEDVLQAGMHLLTHLSLVWETLALKAKARFEKLFFPEGILYRRETGFQTTKLGLIFALFDRSSVPTSLYVDLNGISSNQLYCDLTDLIELDQIVRKHLEEQRDAA